MPQGTLDAQKMTTLTQLRKPINLITQFEMG